MTAARFYSSTAGTMTLQADITATASSMEVDSTVGLPGTTPFALVIDPGNAEEVVDVTSVSGTTLVITRAVDGTPAQSHPAGVSVRHMATARDFREPQEHIGNTVAHGTVGDVVGTSNTQALINKDLSSGTNTFPSSLTTDAELAAEAALRVAHAASTSTHGVLGAIVGTTDTQTLSNKTINGSALNSPTVSTPTFLDDVNVGDDTSGTARYFTTERKANTGTNRVRSKFYTASGSGDVNGAAALVVEVNDVEVARAQLSGTTGDLAVQSGDIVADNIPTSGVAGTSTTKATKRLHWGTFSGTTDNNGFVNVTHGAGFTPTVVTFTPTTALQHAVDTIGATTFRLRVVSSDGTAPGSPVSVSGTYFCGE